MTPEPLEAPAFPPPPAESPWARLLVDGVVYFALQVLGVMIASALGLRPKAGSFDVNAALGLLVYSQIGLLAMGLVRLHSAEWPTFPKRAWWLLAAAPTAALGLLLLSAAYGGAVSRVWGPDVLPKSLPFDLNSLTDVQKAVAVAVIAVVGPVAEETFFRGYLLRSLADRGWPLAVGVSSLCFALLHFKPVLLPYYLAAGWVFAWLYRQSGRLLVPIVAHAVHNGVLVMALLSRSPGN